MELNETQFWQLIEREHQQARIFCHRVANNSEEGDDVYQDAVMHAFHGFNKLKDTNSFRPWFYQIIRNSYYSKFRTGWWKWISTKYELSDYGPEYNPLGHLEAKRRLEYAMKALSPDDRLLMILFEIEGWKISELAQMMKKKEGVIKMRLLRARTKMRNELASFYRKTIKQSSI